MRREVQGAIELKARRHFPVLVDSGKRRLLGLNAKHKFSKATTTAADRKESNPLPRAVAVIMKLVTTLAASVILGIATSVCAGGIDTHIPMTLKGSETFYVSGWMAGTERTEFMVDTGSSYMTINQVTLNKLKTIGQVEYLRDLIGVLANGDELVVPVYRIPRIVLGNTCELFDVEAAVFPGKTRQILGLSVLRKAAPFMFSIDPPELQLSNCSQQLSQSDQ